MDSLPTRHRGIPAIIAWITGVTASAGGLWLSFRYDLPTGPLIVCVFGLLLFAAFVAQRLRGEAV